ANYESITDSADVSSDFGSFPGILYRSLLFLGREHTAQNKQFAQLNAVRLVDIEDGGRGAAARRQADKPRALPGKVPAPALPARIEQHDRPASDGVAATQIAGFSQVAFETRPGQIAGIVPAMVFPGDDVVDMEAEQRLIGFVQTAIFAALVGSSSHELPNRCFHADCPLRAK